MSKPVLLTAQGTGADMWTGYPADLARRMEDLYYFQPIGKYPAQVFPMGPSVKIGVDEGVDLVLQHEAKPAVEVPDGYALCGYSQGGWLVSDLLDEFRTGRLKHLSHKVMAGATFGNPRRELDTAGGRGIADKLLVGTPDFWVDEFDPADIYANVPNNDVGEDMTAIFKIVRLNSLLDLLGIVEKVTEILQSPLQEFPAAVQAIVKGLLFFGRKPATAPHVEYHIRQRSPGVTYYEHAVAHMRRMAA
ncbi:DNA helicase [Mycobacterium phage SirPhilip]|uniref:Lysin B n=1 Tax=Mycobacterium phage SirPhilip TaxID=2015824 RepID=A0A222ZLR0_9CAUD|nr:DNA helicase [Mycobacterium phage SirPhilip]ASR85232.1 lysin B [Mycobacterium phage SirPhilip]